VEEDTCANAVVLTLPLSGASAVVLTGKPMSLV